MKKLETTKRIVNNAVLRVYKKGFGYTKLVVINAHEYYLGVLTDDEFIKKVKTGDKLEVYLWVEEVASYDFILEVIGKIDSIQKILFFKHSNHLVRNEERRCLTAEVNLPLKFFIFKTGNNKKSFSSEEVDIHYGTLLELGDRSAKIKCNDELSGDVFYKGHIAINGEDLELLGKFEFTGKKDIYEISFTGMHEKERNRILDYIFSIYRE